MATHVVKSVKFPMCIPAYDKFYISESSCEEIIWVLDLSYVTNSLPPAEEDAVEFEPEEFRIGVPLARRRHRRGQRYRRVALGSRLNPVQLN